MYVMKKNGPAPKAKSNIGTKGVAIGDLPRAPLQKNAKMRKVKNKIF